jgi:hypothetical protein
MSEAQWDEDGGQGAAAGKKKKRIPTWALWTCGGGCLLMTLIVGALTVLGVRVAKQFNDPDKAWERVGEVLPYDTRPAGWEARGFSLFGTGMYALDPPGSGVRMMLQRFAQRSEVEALLDPSSPQNQGLPPFGRLKDAEAVELELQGRSVRALRFRGGWVDLLGLAPTSGDEGDFPGLRLDLSSPQGAAMLHVWWLAAEAPPGAAELEALLAPFDLWRGR